MRGVVRSSCCSENQPHSRTCEIRGEILPSGRRHSLSVANMRLVVCWTGSSIAEGSVRDRNSIAMLCLFLGVVGTVLHDKRSRCDKLLPRPGR